MVDLTTLQTASYISQMIGVFGTLTAAFIAVRSYTNANKRAEDARRRELETRQAQLMMGVAQSWWSKDFVEAGQANYKIYLKNMKDINDILENKEKFTQWNIWVSFFEAIGVLVRNGLVDVNLVSQLMSGDVISMWERNREGIYEARRELGFPRLMVEFEYLYGRIVEHGKAHPELGVVSNMAYPSLSTQVGRAEG